MPSSESSFRCLDTPDASTLQQSHKHMAFCGVLHSQSLQTNESRLTSPSAFSRLASSFNCCSFMGSSYAYLRKCANKSGQNLRNFQLSAFIGLNSRLKAVWVCGVYVLGRWRQTQRETEYGSKKVRLEGVWELTIHGMMEYKEGGGRGACTNELLVILTRTVRTFIRCVRSAHLSTARHCSRPWGRENDFS